MKTVIEWHLYPAETPNDVGRYIVLLKDGRIEITDCEYYEYSGTYQFDINNVYAWGSFYTLYNEEETQPCTKCIRFNQCWEEKEFMYIKANKNGKCPRYKERVEVNIDE